jgi:hypothetical protein
MGGPDRARRPRAPRRRRPRPRAAIVAALAGRHAKEDVVRTLMRLAVTGRLVEAGGRYAPARGGRARSDAG